MVPKFSLSSPSSLKLFSIPIVFSSNLKVFLGWENKVNKHSYYSYKIWLCPSLVPHGAFGSVNPGLCRKLWRHRERLTDKVQTSRGQRGKRERLGTRLAASQCFSLWRADYTSRIGLVFRAGSFCWDLGTLIKRNKFRECSVHKRIHARV